MKLLAGTERGLVIAAQDGEGWVTERRTLEERAITSVIAREGVILAGTRDGIWRSDDGGVSWQAADDGLNIRHVRWLAYHPQLSDYEYAGTEPAAIYTSVDGARTWQRCPEVEEMRDRFGWRLPYSSEAGCVRGFAFYGQRAYAAVEDGAVLRSDDVGATWALAPGSAGSQLHYPAEGGVHSDVHAIEVHASSAERVVAPTGGGLYASNDGGSTWQNLYRCYCRAVWLDPEDVNHLIFGPASGVDREGRIEESRDGGATWQAVAHVPGAPWARTMVERLTAHHRSLFAVLSSGDLLVAKMGEWRWERTLPDVERINGLAFMGNWS